MSETVSYIENSDGTTKEWKSGRNYEDFKNYLTKNS